MLRKISTKDMSRAAWLEKRRGSIGGSDAAAVLGLSAYRSPYALWCEKTGRVIPEDISEKEAVRTGSDLEDYVAKRWTEKTGKKVRRDNHMIYNSAYPFAHANIDRTVVGENAGLECKTTGSREILQQCRDGKLPAHWYAQALHYMMVTGAEKWYLGVLVFGRGFFTFSLTRKEEEIAALEKAEREFWQCVAKDVPPPVDGKKATHDALRGLFAKSVPGAAKDLSGVEEHLKRYVQLKAEIRAAEAALSEHQAHIMQYMGEAEKGRLGNIRVKYKTQTRQSFDRAAFEADHGAIPPAYFSETTTRPLKVTADKEG